MRKFSGLSTVYSRSTVLLMGVLLCSVAFGIVAWNIGSASEKDVSLSTSDVATAPLGQRDGTITRYENGVVKIEPTAFAITGPARDLPIFDDDLSHSSTLRFLLPSRAPPRL